MIQYIEDYIPRDVCTNTRNECLEGVIYCNLKKSAKSICHYCNQLITLDFRVCSHTSVLSFWARFHLALLTISIVLSRQKCSKTASAESRPGNNRGRSPRFSSYRFRFVLLGPLAYTPIKIVQWNRLFLQSFVSSYVTAPTIISSIVHRYLSAVMWCPN